MIHGETRKNTGLKLNDLIIVKERNKMFFIRLFRGINQLFFENEYFSEKITTHDMAMATLGLLCDASGLKAQLVEVGETEKEFTFVLLSKNGDKGVVVTEIDKGVTNREMTQKQFPFMQKGFKCGVRVYPYYGKGENKGHNESMFITLKPNMPPVIEVPKIAYSSSMK